LAWLWTAVSAGAFLLLFHDPAWWRAGGVLGAVRAVRVEQWVAVGLLCIHAGLIWRAWRSGRPA